MNRWHESIQWPSLSLSSCSIPITASIEKVGPISGSAPVTAINWLSPTRVCQLLNLPVTQETFWEAGTFKVYITPFDKNLPAKHAHMHLVNVGLPHYHVHNCACVTGALITAENPGFIWPRLGCLSFNAVICTPIIPCWIWCCSYAISQYKIIGYRCKM